MEIHCGGSAFMLALMTSGRSSSTTIFPSRSCNYRKLSAVFTTWNDGILNEFDLYRLKWQLVVLPRQRAMTCFNRIDTLARCKSLWANFMPIAECFLHVVDFKRYQIYSLKKALDQYYIPRFWCFVQLQRRASIGWDWRWGHWWCRRRPKCTSAFLRSSPTT